MAYREFNPAAMEDYRDSTVQMFQDQRDFAESKISQLTTKIGELDKKITELETKISDLNETINSLTNSNDDDGKNNSAISIAEGQRDTAKKDKEDAETERTNAQNAVTALNNAITNIDQGIEKTKSFINDLLSNVETADKQFDAKFDNLLEQINRYKSEMKGFYNSVDTTLRSHGYNGNVNLKSQFSETVNDFADSTMVNTFPYIPERYIYSGGVLKDRILNGIFQKDVSAVEDADYKARMEKLQNKAKQFEQLNTVINRIADKNDLNNLGKFISAGYVFTKVGHNSASEEYRHYALSESFQKFASNYYSIAKQDMVNSIINGTSLPNLSKTQTGKLQLGALLNSFVGQMPTISTKMNFDEKGEIHKLAINLSQSNRGSFKGLEVSLQDNTKMFGDTKWFVSEFNSDLGRFLPNFQKEIALFGLENFKVSLENDFSNVVLGWMIDEGLEAFGDKAGAALGYGKDIYEFAAEQKEKIDALKYTVSLNELNSFFTKMKYGGILIQGKDNQIILDNNIMELNGAEGLGVALEAYNYQHGITSGTTAEEYYRWYNDVKDYTVDNNGMIGDVFKWLSSDDTSGRYVTGYGTDYRDSYAGAVIQAAGRHNIPLDLKTASYKDYKKIIETYPEDVEYFFNNSTSD